MKSHHLIVIVLLMSIGAGIIVCSPPTEEDRIKKQFDKLVESMGMERDEKPLVTARKMRELGSLFTPQCKLKAYIDAYSGVYAPDEITVHTARFRRQFSRISLKFYDITIEFPEDGTAKAALTARMTGSSSRGERVDDSHELHFILTRTEDEWLISSVEIFDVLRR